MDTPHASRLLLSFVSLLFFTTEAVGEEWRTFESKSGRFVVQYPASWQRLGERPGGPGPDSESLDIVNFPPGEAVTGVIIRDQGAEIVVLYGPPESGTLSGVDAASRHERELIVESPAPHGCKVLREVTWRYDVSGVGKAYQSSTAYYCPTDCGLFAVVLTNWDNDPNVEELRSVARSIARSLRALPPRPSGG